MNGKLFVVATPIGNMKDITLRALEILGEVDIIFCEDTRVTRNLLSYHKIQKPLYSINSFSEEKRIKLVEKFLSEGKKAALLSDAGTPCISDPGVRLINYLRRNEFEIIGIPGANAAILGLSIAGLPTDSFVFEGFLPQKKGRRKKLLALENEERTIILYESVYRISKLLNELKEIMPERFLVIFRELTKMFEEKWQGYPESLLNSLQERTIKGEFVIIIAPKNWTGK